VTELDAEQVLFANEAFCLAFTSKDADAMDVLRAKSAPLVCVHSGWHLLTGREEIVDSWRRILGNPQQPGIDFYDAEIHRHQGMALVTCYEELPGGVCLATNGFIEEDEQLRMVVHHSDACGNPPRR